MQIPNLPIAFRSPLASIDRSPLTVAPSMLLADAIALMSQARNSCPLLHSDATATASSNCVLVVKKKRLVGLLCEKDAVQLMAAKSSGKKLRVRQVMTRNLTVLKESEFRDIFTAIYLLQQHSLDCLPIVDESGNLSGLVTIERICQLIQGADLLRWRRVAEVMLTNPITSGNAAPAIAIAECCVHPEDDLWEANQKMLARQVRELPVTDSQGALVGIVTQNCLLKIFEPAEMYKIIEGLQQQVAFVDRQYSELQKTVATEAADRQNVETALRQSEARYRAIVEDQTELICRYLPDGTITFANQAYCRYFGISAAQAIGNSFWPLILEEDRAFFAEQYTSVSPSNPCFSCEHRVILPDGEIRTNHWSDRAIFDETGKIVEYQGVGRDVSDRKLAETALQQLNAELEQRVQQRTERYELAVTAGKVGVWDWDLATGEIYTDPFLKAFLGYGESDLGNGALDWTTVIHPDDLDFVEVAVNAHLESVTADFEIEHRMLCKDGSIRWMHARGTTLRHEAGQPYRITGTVTDITDRKLAQEKLENSEAELLALFHGMTDIVLVMDSSGRYLKVAPTLPELLYKSAEQLIGKTASEVLPPEAAQICVGYVRKTLATQQTQRVEYSLEVGGKLRWFESNVSPFGVDRVIWVARDITDRFLVEAALQKSEEQFRNLFDDAPIALSLARVDDFSIVKVNEVYRQMFGYSDSQLQGMTFTQLTHPEDIRADLEQFQQLVEGKISRFAIEKRSMGQNGNFLWVNLTVTLIRNLDGTPIYSMGAIEDISQRKRAELELQQLKERLEFLLASNPAVIFTVRVQGDFAITYISDNVMAIVGYSAQEFLADADFWYSRVHPEDIMQFLIGFGNLSSPCNRTCEYRFLHRDGNYRWLRTELTLLADCKGKPTEIIGYAADITNSKCAEIALRQQFEQERLVGAIARRVRQSLQLAEILNTTVAELQQVLLADRVMVYQILPDGSARIIAEAVAEGCTRLLNSILSAEVLGLANYQENLLLRLNNVCQPQRQISSPYLSDLPPENGVMAKLTVPIVQVDRVWGLLIAHQCDRERNWLEWEINLFQQLADQLAIAIQQSLLYQQLQAELNERTQAEEKLKNSLKEKEILLKEIHHRVKNNLCVVASLLELQSDTVADSHLAKMFEESQNRLYSMALIHEKLYRSKNLAQINFGEYLKDLVTNLFDSYNISARRIELQVLAEPILLNLETATPCGLIANELVSNTLKHAFPKNKSGTVSVECYQTGDRTIHLLVKDNGTGFPKNLDFRKTGSMGFQVVCTLTEQLEATLELSGEIGTTFHLKFKELKYSRRF